MLKALSLTQPWATAVAVGVKQWETRSWPTGFRGEVAIHAAKGMPKWAKDFAQDEQCSGRLPLEMPRGAIIALADLTECCQTETMLKFLAPQEIEFGDFGEGRFCYRLQNVRPLPTPITAKGALGFWLVPEEVEAIVLRSGSVGDGVRECHYGSAECDQGPQKTEGARLMSYGYDTHSWRNSPAKHQQDREVREATYRRLGLCVAPLCGQPAENLCAWKIPAYLRFLENDSATCDRPICARHGMLVRSKDGEIKYLCPEHQRSYEHWRGKKDGRQGSLFEGAA